MTPAQIKEYVEVNGSATIVKYRDGRGRADKFDFREIRNVSDLDGYLMDDDCWILFGNALQRPREETSAGETSVSYSENGSLPQGLYHIEGYGSFLYVSQEGWRIFISREGRIEPRYAFYPSARLTPIRQARLPALREVSYRDACISRFVNGQMETLRDGSFEETFRKVCEEIRRTALRAYTTSTNTIVLDVEGQWCTYDVSNRTIYPLYSIPSLLAEIPFPDFSQVAFSIAFYNTQDRVRMEAIQARILEFFFPE